MTNHTDLSGQKYTSPDNKPAQNGVSVQIQVPGGQVPGTMIGGTAVPNKQQ